MRTPSDYSLELTFSGPLLSQAPGVLAFGMDVAMQRYQKQPVLNGSLIRGNIRHALEAFAELLPDALPVSQIEHWFGAETSDADYTPKRATIDFDFFWKLQQPLNISTASPHRTRIKLEEDTEKVARGALQIIEDCFPSGGSNITFEGRLHARFTTKSEEEAFIHWLSKALDYIPAMGSFKGTGFGKLECWRVKENNPIKPKPPKLHSFPDGNTRIGITLYFDHPFCLGRPCTPESNRIVSNEMISGNVIKGVIARQYPNGKLPKDLCFDDLIITHAVPIKANPGRPQPLPLSLATYKKKAVDMSLASAADKWDEAPVFKPDWKADDDQAVKAAWSNTNNNPGRYLSIRTEINPKSGISEESHLFTLDCIDPYGFVWCADIELCQIEESKRPAAYARLAALLQQDLTGIGKTKARAKVTIAHPFMPFKQIEKKLPCWQNDRYIVALQSSARLLPPTLKLSGVNSHIKLKEHYQSYWSRQHKGIILEHYFAQQQLSSTYYHQQQNSQGSGYHPEWLTTAGSVFILKIEDDKALKQLTQWNRTGLPAHPNRDGSKADWRSTPYLPEHGYGEIIINDPRQLNLLYQPEQNQ